MLVLLLLITTLQILLFTWYFFQKRKYNGLDEALPGPPQKWFTGNVTEFGNDIFDFFQNTYRIIRTYGNVVRIWQGPLQMNLFITDPNIVEFFLSSTIHIKKSARYDLLKSWLGDGLVNSSGEIWQKYRKILTPAFHFIVLEQFATSFHNNSQILVEALRKVSGKSVDIFPFMKFYAIDALCETAMAVNFCSQQFRRSDFSSSIDAALDIFMNRFYSVLKRNDFFFSFTSEEKTYQNLIKTMHDITLDVIKNHRREKEGRINKQTTDNFGIRKRRVFLDILLEYPGLAEQEIEWQVNTFLFAGRDTVASCLSFSLYELAKHQDVQNNLLKEITEVIGNDPSTVITASALKELRYLDRVVKECMRLYPPVPLFERELLSDAKIGSLQIPKGTTISFHPYSQHRDPSLFPNPEIFDPDRFLPENTLRRHSFSYIPFSAGPRNCIGQKYAIMSVKSVLVNIIRNFDVGPSEYPHTPILGNDPVMKSKNGLPIILRFRN